MIRRRWEVSIVEFDEKGDKRFKVTRRIPSLSMAETKIFKSKAKKQFEEWLS